MIDLHSHVETPYSGWPLDIAQLRAVGMSAAARAVGDETLARWLTEEVPAAVLAGTRIPQRPERKQRGWRPRLRG